MIVLDTLEDNEAVIDKGDLITADIVSVCRMDVGQRKFLQSLGGGKVLDDESGIGVGGVSCSPVGRGRDGRAR